jgi:putative transposase
MWTPTTREQHNRKAQRYQSDLTDEEWRVIEPHLPEPRATGRPRSWAMREIVNGIFYVMRAGCAWRLLPTDFPPWGTIYRWFATFRDDGHFEAINHTLVMADRERVGREASPTGAIIDSQSVKTTEAGGPRGYDAGKKINGRKRHALVDTDGRGLVLEPHPASIQDRDGGGPLLRASRGAFPFIKKVFADSGYAGDKVAKATPNHRSDLPHRILGGEREERRSLFPNPAEANAAERSSRRGHSLSSGTRRRPDIDRRSRAAPGGNRADSWIKEQRLRLRCASQQLQGS